jgi:formate hydrogenlyase subunit 6/NADH:ubiquinone oxidoreductase subunit I/protein involved in ribonucleotide reduction
MNITIYYFTGTGNSLKVAKDLALHLENVELVQIRQHRLAQQLHTNADIIGFVVPTIFSGIPKLVLHFVQQLEIKNPSPYIFAIATHGDRNGMGIVFEQIIALLAEKELTLSASFGIQMPHNMPEKDHTTTAKEKARLCKESAARISIIAENIKNQKLVPHHTKKIRMFFDRMTYKAVNKSADKIPFDSGFYVDKNCNSCLCCSKVCPATNIDIVDGKPKWKLENCQFCFACVQWCPTTAIQYKKGTIGVERYHHPDIKVNELF